MKTQRQDKKRAGNLADTDAGALLADRPSVLCGAIVAVGALGAAIHNGNGMLHNNAITWLGVGLVASVLGLVWPRTQALQEPLASLVPLLLAAVFAYDFSMWLVSRPALYLPALDAIQRSLFYIGIGTAAVACGATLNPWPRLNKPLVGLLLLTYTVLGIWLIHLDANPHVDVVVLHREAFAAMLDGRNPFAITFPNIYPDVSNYGPGMVENGRVLFGYDYPPVNLLLALPAHVLGDYRYALLVANVAAGALVAWTRPSWLATAAMGLLLFTPRALFILENGWIEPFAILFLAATVWGALHRPAWVPYALGLLLASKQYVVLLMASAWLLPTLPSDLRSRGRFVLQAGLTAAAVTLPFFLWSPADFWHSVITTPLNHPFRLDALNYLAWWKQEHGTILPYWLGFAGAVVASWLALKRLPHTVAGFAYAFGFIFLVFIAFNRQAFCNYYHLIIGAFCVCLGGASHSLATARAADRT